MFDKSKFKSTKVDGVVTLTYEDKDAFKAGTEISADTLKEVHNYHKTYTAEAASMATELGKETMKKDKTINKVVVEFPYTVASNGKLTVGVHREKEYVNAFTKTGEKEIIKRPAVTVVAKDPSSKLTNSLVKKLVADLNDTFNS